MLFAVISPVDVTRTFYIVNNRHGLCFLSHAGYYNATCCESRLQLCTSSTRRAACPAIFFLVYMCVFAALFLLRGSLSNSALIRSVSALLYGQSRFTHPSCTLAAVLSFF
jgi:hypothetical protein